MESSNEQAMTLVKALDNVEQLDKKLCKARKLKKEWSSELQSLALSRKNMSNDRTGSYLQKLNQILGKGLEEDYEKEDEQDEDSGYPGFICFSV